MKNLKQDIQNSTGSMKTINKLKRLFGQAEPEARYVLSQTQVPNFSSGIAGTGIAVFLLDHVSVIQNAASLNLTLIDALPAHTILQGAAIKGSLLNISFEFDGSTVGNEVYNIDATVSYNGIEQPVTIQFTTSA